MSKIYLITSLVALAFFSYAQHQGMSFTGGRGQQIASSGSGVSGGSRFGNSGSGRSSTSSHK